MELIYETTDKQKKEFQHGLYHKILKDFYERFEQGF